MSLHIIIDGSNLIRKSNMLSSIDHQDIQMGREALIDILASYKKIKSHRITVIFDGVTSPSFLQRDHTKGIEIKFSHSGESADTLIKRMASREKEKALVVSSDQDVVNFASAQGSSTISSTEFEEKMITVAYMNTKGFIKNEEESGWIPTTKKKGPSRRLSKKDRKSRIKIRKL